MLLIVLSLSSLMAQAQTHSSKKVRVGIMLPLHNINGDGTRMVEYYRGVLMAIEDLKKQGVSVDVRAWNVPEDADVVKLVLKDGTTDCDIIFGPLYSVQVKILADFCRAYDVKMVIPFSISNNEVENNAYIYQVYQRPTDLEKSAIDAFVNRFAESQDNHFIFIDCADPQSTKGNFTSQLRQRLESLGLTYNLTSVNTPLEQFAKAFAGNQQNIIVLNSEKSPALNKVYKKLDELQANYQNVHVTMYGYTDWMMYEKYNTEKYFRYDTYIPTTHYFNEASVKTRELLSRYRSAFETDMQYALPHFALTGYDQAMFFISGVLTYGKKFTGSKWQAPKLPAAIETPYKFERTAKGGFINKSFMLIHYKPSRQIESLAY